MRNVSKFGVLLCAVAVATMIQAAVVQEIPPITGRY
jgi:hypothetical protein